MMGQGMLIGVSYSLHTQQVNPRQWLYQAGLNNFSIVQMGCYWNPDLERVVVPFQRYSGEASWVARRTHGNGAGPAVMPLYDGGYLVSIVGFEPTTFTV